MALARSVAGASEGVPPPLGTPCARIWRSFRLIFALPLLASIFHRFAIAVGWVLGGLWEAKTVENRDFECFWE